LYKLKEEIGFCSISSHLFGANFVFSRFFADSLISSIHLNSCSVVAATCWLAAAVCSDTEEMFWQQ